MEYETLEALMMAYRRGDLAEPLFLDNDSTYVYTDSGEGPQVFDMHPVDVMRQALKLLGIPFEEV